MNNAYAKAYTEVLEILNFLSKEEYSKIPIEEINFLKEHMDTQYVFKINPLLNLSEQNISKEAYSILVTLFRDYFATEAQKKTLNILLNQNQEKLDNLKKQQYDSHNLFKKDINTYEEKNDDKNLIEYKQSFFNKFVNFIKKIKLKF